MKKFCTKESMTITFVTLSVIFLFTIVLKISFSSNSGVLTYEQREIYKDMVPTELEYSEKVTEPRFKNLNMIGQVETFGVKGTNFNERIYGMVLRTLRFQNITRKVEEKYELPENLLLAMVMQESGGVDLLPNSSDDGGLGLCHMQPSMSVMFGLKTYDDCKKLRCTKHGKALRWLIQKHKFDRKQLVQYDDRFHPILNLDAAGRMLAYYMVGKQLKETKIQTAILGYAGRKNYEKYYENVMFFMEKLNNEDVIDAVEEKFNRLNPHLTIDGDKADFEDYIEAHQEQNRNYGLDNYK